MPEILRHTSELLCPDSRRPAGDRSDALGPDRYRSDGYRAGRLSPDRYCPDCGRSQSFEQHHGPAGWCPDTADRYCPEWYCLACGAALLIGAFPVEADLVGPAEIRDRVA
jgi:hypothetical protein